MSIFREIPPTAGFPLYWKDILAFGKPGGYGAKLEQDFRIYLDVPYARVTYSGTAAFYFILESLKGLTSKKTVIIPAFICPLVPLAVQRAGFKIQVCDNRREDFNFNRTELENICAKNPDIAAVVTAHLGGVPLDIDTVKEITRPRKIFIIEDCAQALGAESKGKKCGSAGDFSFFSLCRGKGPTMYEGGVAIAGKKEHGELLSKAIDRLEKKDLFSEGLKILELCGYGIFYRPLLFWFVFRLPQIYWTRRGDRVKAMGEDFSFDFPVHAVSAIRKAIGRVMFKRLDEEIDRQREKAYYYITKLKTTPGIRIIQEFPGDKGVYPYCTVVFEKASERSEFLKKTESSGLGVSIVYVQAITDYAYLRQIIGNVVYSGARSLAERTVTLSTSRFINKPAMDKVIAILNDK